MQNQLAQSHDRSDATDTRRMVGARARVGCREPGRNEPQIHVNKSNGRIESIQISCGCGEQIRVVCEYRGE
ncbi:MAG: hypothetical protein AAFU85_19705 [Planctomycetota bacterium]